MPDIHNQLAPDIFWAFVLGTMFLVAILAIAVFVRKPTSFLITVVKIILPLAGAGFADGVTGLLTVDLHPYSSGAIRASGAMAVLVILYFFVPAGLIVHNNAEEPEEDAKGDPELVASSWLSLIDQHDYRTAWSKTARATQTAFPRPLFDRLYKEQVEPLGDMQSRKILGAATAVTLSNGKRGNFRIFRYRTRFSNDSGRLRDEEIVVTVEDGAWKVENHNVNPRPVDLA